MTSDIQPTTTRYTSPNELSRRRHSQTRSPAIRVLLDRGIASGADLIGRDDIGIAERAFRSWRAHDSSARSLRPWRRLTGDTRDTILSR